MKFPSIIKTPKNRRFELVPRYYDPVKEELEERTRRIKREMEVENPETQAQKTNSGDYLPGRISFERRTGSSNTSLLQLIIAATLGITVVGWLYYGNQVFYALWVVVPIYLFFRLRGGFGQKR